MLNSTTVFGYWRVAALLQGNLDEHLHQTTNIEQDRRLPHKHLNCSSTKLNMHHVEFFFIFRTLIVCFHGVLGVPHAIHAVKGRACECTQVFPRGDFRCSRSRHSRPSECALRCESEYFQADSIAQGQRPIESVRCGQLGPVGRTVTE